MKNSVFVLIVFILFHSPIYPQDPLSTNNKADMIIEGGNLIIEVLKVFNKDGKNKKTLNGKEKDCELLDYTNICFHNKTDYIIIVKLSSKERVEIHELMVNKNGKEYCYKIKSGVYSYIIEQKQEDDKPNRLIRKGNILLESCKELEIKIKR